MKDSLKTALVNLLFFLSFAALVFEAMGEPGSITAPLALSLTALMFLLSIYNINAVKRILRKAERLQTEREVLLEKMIAVSPAGIFLVDGHGIILDLNLKAESWFYERKEDICGKSLFRNVDCDLKNSRSFKTIFFNDMGTHFPAEIQIKAMDPGTKWKYAVYVEDLTDVVIEQDKLLKMANEDALTGLLNRRSFLAEMNKEIERTSRTGLACTLALIDLDHFKKINDTYGHDFGDEVLKTFARILKENARSLDIISRYGGEEFVILFPHTDGESSLNYLNRVKDLFAGHCYSSNIQPTFSCGVVSGELKSEVGDVDKLLKEADTLLYRAKEKGRNRIETSGRRKIELIRVS